ncbi:hypothetical protein M9Y10_020318 [Tritrichomonas musculus]|uniref:NIF system FeS cluster assembly NifU C-terminal domain-containing protein n=1 Tax=Tritrichomonas musculus TaxID=1915356 RepID=A0ABR2HFW8_9EUKA
MISAFTKGTSKGFFSRFFALSNEELVKECDKIVEKIIRPTLQKEGSDIIFHGIEDGCAVISLEGEASICDCEKCSAIPTEVLQLFQHFYPEITTIRKKLDYED